MSWMLLCTLIPNDTLKKLGYPGGSVLSLPNLSIIATYKSAQSLQLRQNTTVLGKLILLSLKASHIVSTRQSSSMEGTTERKILGLSGDSPMTTRLFNDSLS